MAVKRNESESTLAKAQRVLNRYVKPGRRSAEATIEELMKLFGTAREALTGVKRGRGRPLGSKNKTTTAARGRAAVGTRGKATAAVRKTAAGTRGRAAGTAKRGVAAGATKRGAAAGAGKRAAAAPKRARAVAAKGATPAKRGRPPGTGAKRGRPAGSGRAAGVRGRKASV